MRTISTLLFAVCIIFTATAQDLHFEMVKDINTSGNSYPSNLTVLDGKIYFAAKNGSGDQQLWVTDGTEDGTQLVKDISINDIIVLNDKLIFTGDDGSGIKLWSSDGTSGGTQSISDNLDFPGNWNIGLTVLNNKAYFAADDGTHGNEIWVTDGTAGGTQMLKDINPNGNSTDYRFDFTEFNGKLYFAADDGIHGEELWVTDGTTGGTKMFSDISYEDNSSSPRDFTEFNGKLYFSADAFQKVGSILYAYGRELWVTDGTESGTQMVKDIYATLTKSSNPKHFTEYNGKLYFQADDGTNGIELWLTDGTESGTQMVKDINSGSANSSPSGFKVYDNKLYFIANNGNNGSELWVSDGTTSGTKLFKDINPGGDGSKINILPDNATFDFMEYGDKLFFVADDGTNGSELWITDGTENGTKKIQPDTAPNSDPLVNYTDPYFTELNGSLYFSANYDNNGRELWKLTDPSLSTPTIESIVNLKAYPNPATEQLNLTAQENIKDVIITDLTGKIVYQNEHNTNEINIDVSNLPQALYLVKIVSLNNKTQTLKVIKK